MGSERASGFFIFSFTGLKVIRKTETQTCVCLFFFFFLILDVFHTEGELRATEFKSIVLNSRIGQCASRTSNLGYTFVPKISFLNLHLAKQKEGI